MGTKTKSPKYMRWTKLINVTLTYIPTYGRSDIKENKLIAIVEVCVKADSHKSDGILDGGQFS